MSLTATEILSSIINVDDENDVDSNLLIDSNMVTNNEPKNDDKPKSDEQKNNELINDVCEPNGTNVDNLPTVGTFRYKKHF